MPTKSTRSSKRTYKIKISPERTLGPLDLDRVTLLVMKGRIQGHESTSVDPYTTWAPFTAFPELGELLLKKMETDTHRKRHPEEATQAMPATRTIVSQEATKTMVQGADEPKPKEESEVWEMPTLLDIKAPEKQKEENPDLEKTQVFLPALMDSRDLEDGATKLLTTENIEQALVPYSPPETKPLTLVPGPDGQLPVKRGFFGLGKPVDPDEYIDEKSGKKRLMTRNTAALVAFAIVMMGYWQWEAEEAADPANLFPRRHTFPYIEVNVPPRLGVNADPARSAELTEQGMELISRETPSAYIRAIRDYFYKAVGRNPKNVDAKALLASCYMRLSETVPRNKRLFETIEKLILQGAPPQGQWTPDYVVARAEYYQMLNRHDQAQEIIDAYLKVRPTPEVLYQKAKIAYERRELDTALNMIAKAIPPEKTMRANPRHLLLYATLLEKKGQKEAAMQTFERMKRESISYGPGVLAYGDFLLRNGKPKEAFKALRFLVNNPALLEGMQRAEAFVVTAKTFETLNMTEQAYRFARAAFRDHYNREEVEDLLFRVKSKLPKSKNAYTLIVNARQREKAKESEKAINLYVQSLERNRQDAIPFMMLARLYEEKGDVYEAIDRYKKALDNTPDKPIEAAVNLARIYISRFDMKNAEEMIKRAEKMSLASRARQDQVLYLKAIYQLRNRKADIADPLFEKALDRGSRFVDLYLQMGDLETERKNERLAEFYYSIALRYEPFHPKAMLGVALTRFHTDSPSRAISFLKDKLNTQPNSAAIMTNLAIIYLRSGDQLSGKNYLQNAIRSDSRYAEAFRLLGDLTKDEGNRQSDYSAKRHSYRYALASYEMYSKLAPNDPEGFKATADLYFDIRDLGAAAKNYHKVLDLTPNYPDVRLRLAQISRNGGDSERAFQLLEEEIKINPKSDAAWVEKGNIYMAKKDFLAATKAFTEAARINEKNSDALFGLGVVYHLQGSYDNALSLFGRVIKLDPLKADVYWQMGLIYQKQNNKTKAMQAFTNYKGIVREPAAATKADDKMRELSIK